MMTVHPKMLLRSYIKDQRARSSAILRTVHAFYYNTDNSITITGTGPSKVNRMSE